MKFVFNIKLRKVGSLILKRLVHGYFGMLQASVFESAIYLKRVNLKFEENNEQTCKGFDCNGTMA